MDHPIEPADVRRRLEHELVPYQPLDPADIRPMLVLAPHPDDEVFGCGGLIALALERGVAVHVVIVSDGAQGGDARQREVESRAAAAVLGETGSVPALAFWGVPDRGVQPDESLRRRIGQAIDACPIQWVLAPSPFEVHPDHRAVCRATIDAVRERQQAGKSVDLLLCEIGQPLLPNCLVDITAVADRKARAMRCFGSQLAQQPYADQVTGLNRQRSYTLGPAVTSAEAFWLVDRADLAGGFDGLAASVAERLRLHD